MKRRIAFEFLLFLGSIGFTLLIALCYWVYIELKLSTARSDLMEIEILIKHEIDSLNDPANREVIENANHKSGQWNPPTDALVISLAKNDPLVKARDEIETRIRISKADQANSDSFLIRTMMIIFIIIYPVRILFISIKWAIKTLEAPHKST